MCADGTPLAHLRGAQPPLNGSEEASLQWLHRSVVVSVLRFGMLAIVFGSIFRDIYSATHDVISFIDVISDIDIYIKAVMLPTYWYVHVIFKFWFFVAVAMCVVSAVLIGSLTNTHDEQGGARRYWLILLCLCFGFSIVVYNLIYGLIYPYWVLYIKIYARL